MKPLNGVRIVSVEQFGAAPYGTMLLADLGAEVIKIENATIGELLQTLSTGDATAAGLVQAYLARIAAYDRGGPRLGKQRLRIVDRERNVVHLVGAGRHERIDRGSDLGRAGEGHVDLVRDLIADDALRFARIVLRVLR